VTRLRVIILGLELAVVASESQVAEAHRAYGQSHRRYMQRDPIGQSASASRTEELEAESNVQSHYENVFTMGSPLPAQTLAALVSMNLYVYLRTNPLTVSDPYGLCPPTPPCNVPVSRSPGCTGTHANCSVYLPLAPQDYIACLGFSNSPDNMCRRGCLQRCACAHSAWCRHGIVVWALCHADCIPGCSGGGVPIW